MTFHGFTDAHFDAFRALVKQLDDAAVANSNGMVALSSTFDKGPRRDWNKAARRSAEVSRVFAAVLAEFPDGGDAGETKWKAKAMLRMQAMCFKEYVMSQTKVKDMLRKCQADRVEVQTSADHQQQQQQQQQQQPGGSESGTSGASTSKRKIVSVTESTASVSSGDGKGTGGPAAKRHRRVAGLSALPVPSAMTMAALKRELNESYLRLSSDTTVAEAAQIVELLRAHPEPDPEEKQVLQGMCVLLWRFGYNMNLFDLATKHLERHGAIVVKSARSAAEQAAVTHILAPAPSTQHGLSWTRRLHEQGTVAVGATAPFRNFDRQDEPLKLALTRPVPVMLLSPKNMPLVWQVKQARKAAEARAATCSPVPGEVLSANAEKLSSQIQALLPRAIWADQ